MSLSLLGEDVYALDKLVCDITCHWKAAFQTLPDDFALPPVFLSVLPELKSIYRWSVRLTGTSYENSDPHVRFYFSCEQWSELIQRFTNLVDLFHEVYPLLPSSPHVVKGCFRVAEEALTSATDLLLKWSVQLNLGPSDSNGAGQ